MTVDIIESKICTVCLMEQTRFIFERRGVMQLKMFIRDLGNFNKRY